MLPGSYAVVTYMTGPLAKFVEDLRHGLAPEQSRVRAHLTLLSPRVLESPREKLLAAVKRACYKIQPVCISLGQVETFVPATSTIYLTLDQGARQIRDLRHELNQYDLRAEEPWPFVPHITVGKFNDDAAATKALEEARRQWSRYTGPRDFLVKQLTLVREAPPNRWDDLAAFALGSTALAHESTCPESDRA